MSDLKKLVKRLSLRFKIELEEAEKFLVYLITQGFLESPREEQDKMLIQAKQNNYIKSSSPNNFLDTSSSVLSTLVDNTNNNISKQKNHIVLDDNSWPDGQLKLVRRSKAERIRYNKEIIPSYVKAKKEPPKPTKEISSVIDFWNNLGLRKCNPGTKIYEKSIQNVRKARLGWIKDSKRKFSYEEIKDVIKKFSLSVLDPNYHPVNGSPQQKKLLEKSLDVFMWDDFFRRSLFLEYFEKDLKLLHSYSLSIEEDPNPKVTQIIIDLYVKNILGGIQPKGGFLPNDKIKFINASKKLVEFYNKNKDYMNLEIYNIFSVEDFCELLWESIESDTQNLTYDITPGFLCSDMTFNRRLPAYLYQQGIIDDRRELI